jgi:hypothetical protein
MSGLTMKRTPIARAEKKSTANKTKLAHTNYLYTLSNPKSRWRTFNAFPNSEVACKVLREQKTNKTVFTKKKKK